MHLNPSPVPKQPSSPELSTPLFATTIPFLNQFEPMTGILDSDLSYYWLLPTSTNDYEEWRTYLMNEREWKDEMAASRCALPGSLKVASKLSLWVPPAFSHIYNWLGITSSTENPVDELNNPAKASVSQFQDLVAKRGRDEAPKALWPRITLSTLIHYWTGVMAPFWSNWLFTTFHRHHRGTEETFHDGIHTRARICRITRPSHDSLQSYCTGESGFGGWVWLVAKLAMVYLRRGRDGR